MEEAGRSSSPEDADMEDGEPLRLSSRHATDTPVSCQATDTDAEPDVESDAGERRVARDAADRPTPHVYSPR